MKVYHLPLSWFVDNLNNSSPFTFTKYGDGEWSTIVGGKLLYRTNKNGCSFTPELQKELRHTLIYAKYDLGIMRRARRLFSKDVETFMRVNSLDIKWYLADVLLETLLRGQALPFLEALREKRVLAVGQPSLRNLGKIGFLKPVTFYHPPAQNAIVKRVEIIRAVSHIVRHYNIDTILWSSGMHTKVFIHEMWKLTEGEITQIDCGSMWDGFVGGNPNRGYIKSDRVNWQALKDYYSGKTERQSRKVYWREPRDEKGKR